jgi:3-oxoacyl-[acyl-carrier protein] reductase
LFDLTGRKALITGAGHGIGRAIAVGLAQAGADVVVHYGRAAAEAAAVVVEIEALGRKATALAADVTSTDQVNTLLDDATARLGGLDILVCNAGHLVGRVPVEAMPDEHFGAVIDVNLTSVFRCVRAALPALKQSGRGRIVTMSSLAAHNGGGPGSAAYAAAKAGIRGLTKALAKELAPYGITVNALAPGFIGDTTFHGTFTTPAAQQAIIDGVPLRRAGRVDEVAGAVVWLASDAAGYLTGSTVDIDGGAWPR